MKTYVAIIRKLDGKYEKVDLREFDTYSEAKEYQTAYNKQAEPANTYWLSMHASIFQ